MKIYSKLCMLRRKLSLVENFYHKFVVKWVCVENALKIDLVSTMDSKLFVNENSPEIEVVSKMHLKIKLLSKIRSSLWIRVCVEKGYEFKLCLKFAKNEVCIENTLKISIKKFVSKIYSKLRFLKIRRKLHMCRKFAGNWIFTENVCEKSLYQ